MKVKKLIEILKTLPQDNNIYLALDDEGNDFANIDLIDTTSDKYNILWPDADYMDFKDLK